jgi:hypothetical protein
MLLQFLALSLKCMKRDASEAPSMILNDLYIPGEKIITSRVIE